MNRLLVVGLGLTLAACNSGGREIPLDPVSMAGTINPNYKSTILTYEKANLKDPDSVKSASISEPYAIMLPHGEHRWLVCIELNAKNSYGAYTGVTKDGFLFDQAGTLRPAMYPLWADPCGGEFPLTYTPWPALDS